MSFDPYLVRLPLSCCWRQAPRGGRRNWQKNFDQFLWVSVAGISQTFGKALSPGVLGAIQRRFIREGFGLRSNLLPFRLYHFGSGRTRGPRGTSGRMCSGGYEELCLWHWDQASCSSKLQPGPMPTVEDRRMDGGTHWSKETPLPSPFPMSTYKSSPAIDRLSFCCRNNCSVTFCQSVLKHFRQILSFGY